MKLTDGELKVMRLLWQYGEMKPSEIQEKFPEAIKNPAVRSYLSILLEKGHVKRRQVGKAYFYSAKTKERSAFQSMITELIETFCGGSKKSLVMTLLEHEGLTREQLLELSRIAAENAAHGAKCEAKPESKKSNRTNNRGASDE